MDGEEPPRVVLVDPTFLICSLMIFCKKATHDIDHVNVITKVLNKSVNNGFNEHVKGKLQDANECLNVIRCLRSKGFQQPRVDHFVRSIILPKVQSWTKVLGKVMQYSYCSVISGFPHKTVHPFRNFFGVLPPPPYKKLKLGKNSG